MFLALIEGRMVLPKDARSCGTLTSTRGARQQEPILLVEERDAAWRVGVDA